MRSSNRTQKSLPTILVLLALTGAVGCGSGGSSSAGGGGNPPPVDNPPPVVTVTPIPTAPTGLAALAAPSAGFSVVASVGMAAPVPAVAPVPAMTGGTIINKDAAIRLGKALFWDMQTGSDGQTACASCHFNAGADNRTINTMHPGPGLTYTVGGGPGTTFNFATFNGLTEDDVVGSNGVFSRNFVSIATDLNDAVDVCPSVAPGDPAEDTLYYAVPEQRLVTGRNTPPTVGAVFYMDNFWDGRASHDFDALNPLGQGTKIAGFSSLASQAIGPPLSNVEMSCAGRTFNGPNSLGAKLVLRTPLGKQLVDPTDSVLGPLSNAPANGLTAGFPDRKLTYADLIAAAFGTNGLSGQAAVDYYINNFSSIWGQAIQAYEATLVPDHTPYDLGTLTPTQVVGITAMRASGCTVCHMEPEFTDASVRAITTNGGTGVQKLVNGLPGGDQGYHNIGASLSAKDPGRAASPGGTYHVSTFNNGAFKTAALRNVKLTAPYFHNGAVSTLLGVLDFYDGVNQDRSNPDEFDPAAQVGISGGPTKRAAALDFLTNGLTDPRVEKESAPFDHPSLVIPNGQTLPAVGRLGK